MDALVAKKERLIELHQEKRSTLINQTVTKGLDPSVPHLALRNRLVLHYLNLQTPVTSGGYPQKGFQGWPPSQDAHLAAKTPGRGPGRPIPQPLFATRHRGLRLLTFSYTGRCSLRRRGDNCDRAVHRRRSERGRNEPPHPPVLRGGAAPAASRSDQERLPDVRRRRGPAVGLHPQSQAVGTHPQGDSSATRAVRRRKIAMRCGSAHSDGAHHPDRCADGPPSWVQVGSA